MTAAGEPREVDEIVSEALSLPYGDARVTLLEEAVREADRGADLETAFRTRSQLTQSAVFSGYPDRALASFAWCLAQHDRHAGRFDEYDLLWQYKWIVLRLPGFPEIPLERIDAMLQDCRRRFHNSGSGERAAHYLEWSVAREIGDSDRAAAARRAYLAAPRDELSDCAACERDTEVEYRIETGRHAEAIELAGPILRGTLSCAEVPQRTLAALLRPLLLEGRPEDARAAHVRGYRPIRSNRSYVRQFAQHVNYLQAAARDDAALELFERHLGQALDSSDTHARLAWFLSGWVFLEHLRASGREDLAVRVPSTVPLRREAGRAPLEALLEWLRRETDDLARRFDQRNGNEAQRERIDREFRLTAEARRRARG